MRLDIVEYLTQHDDVRSDLQAAHLRRFPDVEKLYQKFYRVQAGLKNSANLVDCVKIYNMVVTLEQMCEQLQQIEIADDHALAVNVMKPLFDTLEDFNKLKGLLEECIDIGKAKQNDYVINADFDQDLKSFRTKIDQINQDIESLRQSVEDDLGISKRINLVESQQYTYLFEVNKKEGDAGFRRSREQYKQVSVKKGVTCFTCK